MSIVKRKADASESAIVVSKRVKKEASGAILPVGVKRTSSLLAPILQLFGHEGSINGIEYSPNGESLLSCSSDKKLFLWGTSGECTNYGVLEGHKAAVTTAHWTADGTSIVSSSADKTCVLWDAEYLTKVRKASTHNAIINDCSIALKGPTLVASAADDGSCKIWDVRTSGKKPAHSFENKFPLTCVAFSEHGDTVFAGGVDNTIRAWDISTNRVVFELQGHDDIPTGLALSPDGNYLLSNSMDRSLRKWDIRPFAPSQRCKHVFYGLQHNFERLLLRCAWNADGSRVSAGSSDRFVYIWDSATQKVIYRLPGHKGSITDVSFHPTEPIIASASNDKTIFVGETDADTSI